MDVRLRNHHSYLTHLPDDFLCIIFGKLETKLDQESFGLTCHHFLDIQNSNTISLDVGCYPWLSHSSSTGASMLDILLKRFKKLESLFLSGCIDDISDSGSSRLQKCGLKLHSLYNDDLLNVTHQVVSSIASRCPLLTAISLPNCEITSDGLKILTESCKLLKEVNLSSCKKITDVGIMFLIQNCRQLKTLNISNCNKIIGLGFQGCSPTLAILKADNCALCSVGIFRILSGGGLEYLKFASIKCTGYILPKAFELGLSNLTTIDFSKCSFVRDDVILSIVKGCTLLNEWDLSYCDNIRTSGWDSIGSYCKKLEILHVNGCFNFNDEALLALGNGCKRLAVIHMGNCSQASSTGKDLFKAHRKDVMIVEKEMGSSH